MPERPDLSQITDSFEFRSYYFLLGELKAYLREKGLPLSGNKREITDRIAHFMDTGAALPAKRAPAHMKRRERIDKDSVIEENIKCSEVHRAFFRKEIGGRFTFNVAFQNWLRENSGKTYREAIDAYNALKAEARHKQTEISGQFEYNAYIRAFFADNPGGHLNDAIRCWKHKKSLPGHNRYEQKDLEDAGV